MFVALWADGAAAQTAPVSLSQVSLEDLMKIEVSSASRKEQQAEDVPAAVYVITHDDIRRSGMTSVPDLLRLAPGVEVAQLNSNKWSVSVRGFGGLYSNKLLVLVDGRTVYNPLFAGVLWDTEDLMLEDVDRIEVIRGPGAAVWGANAVNGVINIMTRPAADTRGLLVRGSVGGFERGTAAIRYGGTAGANAAYRAYAQLSLNGSSTTATAASANDRWRSFTSGFRGDWARGADAVMVEGTVTLGQQRPLWIDLRPAAVAASSAGSVSSTEVGDVLARWTRTNRRGATFQLQSFIDVAHRAELIGNYRRRTVDIDGVYHAVFGAAHDVVAGGGYRATTESTVGGVGYTFFPVQASVDRVNAFVQDEIALAARRVSLTLGAKFERESDDGSNVQPTARVLWRATPRQRLWGSVSHALRTPSLADKGIRVDFPASAPTPQSGELPIAISLTGNPALEAERMTGGDAGYRVEIGSRATIDVAAFIGRYDKLKTIEPSTPSLTFVNGLPVIRVSATYQNLLSADTRGAEISARFVVSDAWRLDGRFSAFDLSPHPDPTSQDPAGAAFDGSAPAYQWRVHSAQAFGPRLQTDLHLFHVGPLVQLGIAGYTRADARVEWVATPRLSLVAEGHNLFDASHTEFGGDVTVLSTQVPRRFSLRLTWRY